MKLWFDVVLGVMLVLAALAVVGGGPGFRAVSFFIVFGVLMALAWLQLGAIDVALAEAAMGAGLTGVLLLSAQARLRKLARPVGVASRGQQLLSAVVCLAFFVALATVSWQMTVHPGLRHAVTASQGELGVGNAVTAVLLGYRAVDTLFETAVLLSAMLGVWAVAHNAAWGEAPGLKDRVRPDGVLHTFGRLLPPLVVLLGMYWVWVGSDQPGGAFQGGTVLAAALLVLVMTGHWQWPRSDSSWVRFGLVLGIAVFLVLGASGFWLGSFLQWPPDHAKALMVAIECGLAASLALTLALLVAGPPRTQGDA